jgi:hypothetical protein
VVRLEGEKAAAVKSQTLLELSIPQSSVHLFGEDGRRLVARENAD